MQNTNFIQEHAMLISLRISQWAATKHDKKISKEVASFHGSDENMGRFNKSLIAKTALADIQRIASAARLEHYSRTLPWQDDGYRLLSSIGFNDYRKAMQEHKMQWDNAVARFIADYPNFVQEARWKLNGLFNPAEYPVNVGGKFKFDITPPIAVPDASHLVVKLGQELLDSERQRITEMVHTSLNDAIKDIYVRMAELIEKMIDRLSNYDDSGDKVKGIFRDTLVTNISDLLALVPSLNITQDPVVNQFATDIQLKLTRFDAETLRNSEQLRQDTTDAAKEILDKMSAYL